MATSMTNSPLEIALFAYDGANAVDIFGPLQVFSAANDIAKRVLNRETPAYHAQLVSAGAAQLTLSTQTRVLSDATLPELQATNVDTLIIAGGYSAVAQYQQTNIVQQLSALDRSTRRSASVCSGAFILAATGALKGRRATTHWNRAAEFQQLFPDTDLNIDALFTQDGKYSCSAGVTAGIDMALKLVQDDLGRRVALETAREMVAFYHRPGGQSQFSAVLGARDASTAALVKVQEWLKENLTASLDVSQLAEMANMSPRHFSRKFSAETGLSPARYVAQIRLNQARLLLEESRHSVGRVAAQCGYTDAELLRRLFLKELNITPSDYRRRFSTFSAA